LAKEAFHRAAERCENASFAESIAFGLILLGEYERAVALLQKTGNSVNGTNLYLLGLAYYQKGMEQEACLSWETALAFIEKQLQNVPAILSPLMWINLALTRAALGSIDSGFQAIAQGEKVERAKPEEKAVLNAARGILHALQGDAGQAVAALEDSESKYYTAAEARRDPRLKKIAATSEFMAYLKSEK
jgi:tetratricopeptide (TPR) repeat protein